jgi:hypothetical protein
MYLLASHSTRSRLVERLQMLVFIWPWEAAPQGVALHGIDL